MPLESNAYISTYQAAFELCARKLRDFIVNLLIIVYNAQQADHQIAKSMPKKKRPQDTKDESVKKKRKISGKEKTQKSTETETHETDDSVSKPESSATNKRTSRLQDLKGIKTAAFDPAKDDLLKNSKYCYQPLVEASIGAELQDQMEVDIPNSSQSTTTTPSGQLLTTLFGDESDSSAEEDSNASSASLSNSIYESDEENSVDHTSSSRSSSSNPPPTSTNISAAVSTKSMSIDTGEPQESDSSEEESFHSSDIESGEVTEEEIAEATISTGVDLNIAALQKTASSDASKSTAEERVKTPASVIQAAAKSFVDEIIEFFNRRENADYVFKTPKQREAAVKKLEEKFDKKCTVLSSSLTDQLHLMYLTLKHFNSLDKETGLHFITKALALSLNPYKAIIVNGINWHLYNLFIQSIFKQIDNGKRVSESVLEMPLHLVSYKSRSKPVFDGKDKLKAFIIEQVNSISRNCGFQTSEDPQRSYSEIIEKISVAERQKIYFLYACTKTKGLIADDNLMLDIADKVRWLNICIHYKACIDSGWDEVRAERLNAWINGIEESKFLQEIAAIKIAINHNMGRLELSDLKDFDINVPQKLGGNLEKEIQFSILDTKTAVLTKKIQQIRKTKNVITPKEIGVALLEDYSQDSLISTLSPVTLLCKRIIKIEVDGIKHSYSYLSLILLSSCERKQDFLRFASEFAERFALYWQDKTPVNFIISSVNGSEDKDVYLFEELLSTFDVIGEFPDNIKRNLLPIINKAMPSEKEDDKSESSTSLNTEEVAYKVYKRKAGALDAPQVVPVAIFSSNEKSEDAQNNPISSSTIAPEKQVTGSDIPMITPEDLVFSDEPLIFEEEFELPDYMMLEHVSREPSLAVAEDDPDGDLEMARRDSEFYNSKAFEVDDANMGNDDVDDADESPRPPKTPRVEDSPAHPPRINKDSTQRQGREKQLYEDLFGNEEESHEQEESQEKSASSGKSKKRKRSEADQPEQPSKKQKKTKKKGSKTQSAADNGEATQTTATHTDYFDQVAQAREKYTDGSIVYLAKGKPEITYQYNANILCQIFTRDVPIESIKVLHFFCNPYYRVLNHRSLKGKLYFSHLSTILLYSNKQSWQHKPLLPRILEANKQAVFHILTAFIKRLQSDATNIATQNPVIHQNLEDANQSKRLYETIFDYFNEIQVCPEDIKVELDKLIQEYLKEEKNEDIKQSVSTAWQKVKTLPTAHIKNIEEVLQELEALKSCHVLRSFNAISDRIKQIRKEEYPNSSIRGATRTNAKMTYGYNAHIFCKIFVEHIEVNTIVNLTDFCTAYRNVIRRSDSEYHFSYLSTILLYSTNLCWQEDDDAPDTLEANKKAALHILKEVIKRLQSDASDIAMKNPVIHEHLKDPRKSKRLYKVILGYFKKIKICPEDIKADLEKLVQEYLKVEKNKDIKKSVSAAWEKVKSLPAEQTVSASSKKASQVSEESNTSSTSSSSSYTTEPRKRPVAQKEPRYGTIAELMKARAQQSSESQMSENTDSPYDNENLDLSHENSGEDYVSESHSWSATPAQSIIPPAEENPYNELSKPGIYQDNQFKQPNAQSATYPPYFADNNSETVYGDFFGDDANSQTRDPLQIDDAPFSFASSDYAYQPLQQHLSGIQGNTILSSANAGVLSGSEREAASIANITTVTNNSSAVSFSQLLNQSTLPTGPGR